MKWSLPTKATLIAIACSTTAVLAQGFFLSRGTTVAQMWAVLAVPFALCCFVAWLFTWYVTKHRYAALIEAYRQLARGDWAADIPERVDADAEIVGQAFRSMTAALNQANTRLAHGDTQRRRLFADLAHELGTPIMAVLGIADALSSEKLPPDHQPKLLAHLSHEAARLVHLAADVRDLAALDDPATRFDCGSIDVAALARSAVERAELAAAGRVTLACRAESASCEGDGQRIDQVLTNLLSNAVRHTPDGGRIDVVVARETGMVRITVEDTGAGVPDGLLPHLGERLFRADAARDRRTGGHGLGLSIVAAIVAHHRGQLEFGRASSGGLRVTVRLPSSV